MGGVGELGRGVDAVQAAGAQQLGGVEGVAEQQQALGEGEAEAALQEVDAGRVVDDAEARGGDVKRVSSRARRRSQQQASSTPAPKIGPWSTATRVASARRRAAVAATRAASGASDMSFATGSSGRASRSKPAQKLGSPSPVSRTTSPRQRGGAALQPREHLGAQGVALGRVAEGPAQQAGASVCSWTRAWRMLRGRSGRGRVIVAGVARGGGDRPRAGLRTMGVAGHEAGVAGQLGLDVAALGRRGAGPRAGGRPGESGFCRILRRMREGRACDAARA
jgi:hypothetical protein